jgi:hypothetical protein
MSYINVSWSTGLINEWMNEWSGADGSGCASRVALDKLALHSSKALWRSGFQLKGWEPLTLGPERASWSAAWVAAAWSKNRLWKFSISKKRRADWRYSEGGGGSPEDGPLVPPVVGNLRRTLCYQGRWPRMLERHFAGLIRIRLSPLTA